MDQSQIEQLQLAQLTAALKQQMIREIRENQPEKSMNSRLGCGSPGEIRTLAEHIPNIFLPVKLGGGPTLPHFKEQNL